MNHLKDVRVDAHKLAFPVCQGILSDHLYEVLRQLMEFQVVSMVRGDILEVGVLTGATSAYLSLSLSTTERLFLIDPFQDLMSVSQSISEFAKCSAENILCFQEDSKIVHQRRAFFLDGFLPNLRLVHIDGEHSYDAVINDLTLASCYLNDGGMIILDDIFNVASACCTHALFDAIQGLPSLHIACFGLNKAFVCSSKSLGRYRNFFLSLPQRVAEIADLHLRVCLNDWSFERGYLSIHEINKGEAPYQMINQYSDSLDSLLAHSHHFSASLA